MANEYNPSREFLEGREQDLVINPSARVPVCLCLDVSGSMDGDPIKELSDGIQLFYDAVMEDEVTRYSVEVCIVVFDSQASVMCDFQDIGKQTVPTLRASGTTHMGEGVNLALDCLERRKQEYASKGVDYYQPWLVLMTDGEPYGEATHITEEAMKRTTNLVMDRKLTIFPIGIGRDAKYAALKGFSPKTAPLKLDGLKFREFFEWLKNSAARVSTSSPGDSVKLAPVDNFKSNTGWDTLDV